MIDLVFLLIILTQRKNPTAIVEDVSSFVVGQCIIEGVDDAINKWA